MKRIPFKLFLVFEGAQSTNQQKFCHLNATYQLSGTGYLCQSLIIFMYCIFLYLTIPHILCMISTLPPISTVYLSPPPYNMAPTPPQSLS